MPFIVQCPHANCRKFMLVEDSARGSTVECLICGQALQVEGAPAPAAPVVPMAPAAPAARQAAAPLPMNSPPPPPSPPSPSPDPPRPAPTPAASNKAARDNSRPKVIRACPQCGAQMRVPAETKRKIRCPRCAHVFG